MEPQKTKLDKGILRKKNKIEASQFLISNLTRKLQVSKQYGFGTEQIHKPMKLNQEPKKIPCIYDQLEISSRKLEIPREHFMQRWAR